MFDLGAGELVLIVFVVLILFGPKKLPELAQSLGRGMREFKRAQREFTEQINQAVNDDHYKKQRGPELQQPEGSVSRGGSRRLSPDDAASSDAARTDLDGGTSTPSPAEPTDAAGTAAPAADATAASAPPSADPETKL